MAAYTQFGYGYPSAGQVCTNPLKNISYMCNVYIELSTDLGLSIFFSFCSVLLFFAMKKFNARHNDMAHHLCHEWACHCIERDTAPVY